MCKSEINMEFCGDFQNGNIHTPLKSNNHVSELTSKQYIISSS